MRNDALHITAGNDDRRKPLAEHDQNGALPSGV